MPTHEALDPALVSKPFGYPETWNAQCRCGWVGPTMSKAQAIELADQHVKAWTEHDAAKPKTDSVNAHLEDLWLIHDALERITERFNQDSSLEEAPHLNAWLEDQTGQVTEFIGTTLYLLALKEREA